MADTAAIVGAGTTVSYCATSNGTFTAIGEVLDIKAPEVSVDLVEATSYTSGISGYSGTTSAEEWVSAGWRKAGDVTLKVNYVAATSAAVEALLGTKKYWKITLPDTKVIAFAGFLTSFGSEIPLKNTITQDLKIKITGNVTGPA